MAQYTNDDFARIYCVSNSTIRRRLKQFVAVLKVFNSTQRKYIFTADEGKKIIQYLGPPPFNRDNDFLRLNYPDLFLFPK